MTNWVNCPICDSPDMQRTEDGDGNALIHCVNHACASNGGGNADGLSPRWTTTLPRRPGCYWFRRPDGAHITADVVIEEGMPLVALDGVNHPIPPDYEIAGPLPNPID